MGQPGQTSLSERLRSIEAEIAAGQAESALAHCQEIFAQYPRALAVQRVLGEIYLALRKPREALGALDRALAGDPEDARACCARAIIHQMHGDPVAALSWYRRACDARPDDQALRATYREMATRVNRPPYEPTRVGLARLYMRSGLFTHAIREWETLIAENSDLLEAQVGLVETLWRIERTQEAEDWARRVLMNAPACVKPLLIAGVIARDTGRATEAERDLHRAADLDPDHHIARALFADRAMDDASLRVLFWGDEPVNATPMTSAPSGQIASWGSQRASNGPRVERATAQPMPLPTPTTPALTGIPSLADLGSALSRPDLSANLSRPLPPPSRPQQLPPEFHSMFKETENMLWGPDHSEPGAHPTQAMRTPPQAATAPMATPFMRPTAAPPTPQGNATGAPPPAFAPTAQPQQPPQPPQPQQPQQPQQQNGRADQPPFDASAQFVPPALAENQFAMGDTEARRAIRWVQWLQAQGARRRSEELMRSRPTGSLDALLSPTQQAPAMGSTPNVPPPWPFGRSTQLPVTSLPTTGPVAAQPPPEAPPPATAPLTGTLPPPKPEELRQMFAQLEPAAQANDIVDADVVEAHSAPLGPMTPTTTPAMPKEPDAPQAADADWPEALADAFEWPSQPGAASSPGAQFDRYAASNGHAAPDLTLEALEGAHSADGYQQFTLEPGALAAFTGDGHGADAPASEASRALDEFFQGPEEPPLAPVAEEPPAAPPTIAPTDYPARLDAARTLREAGSLDDALVEYRALLKNAPDLLPDVLGDIEAALDEHPEHPELHSLLSDARIRQGDYMAALESLNRSVSLTQPGDE